MTSSLTDDQVIIIRTLSQIIASISIFSSFIVFGLYWFFKEIRQIALELVVWLCISVVLFSITTFIPYDGTIEKSFWCAT